MIADIEKLMNQSLSYTRKAADYRQKADELRIELFESYMPVYSKFKKKMNRVAELESLARKYEKLGNDSWSSFECEAIMANEEEAPFYNLLGAIVAEIAEDYRRCWRKMLDHSTSLRDLKDAVKEYKKLEEFFGGTSILLMLHREQEPNREKIERIVNNGLIFLD